MKMIFYIFNENLLDIRYSSTRSMKDCIPLESPSHDYFLITL